MAGRTHFRFESPEERRKRTCCRSFQATPFVEKILARADEAQGKGEFVTCILDTEGDQVNRDTDLRKRATNWRGEIVPGDIYYHHRRSLQRAGITPPELIEREKQAKAISASWRNKKPARKISDYFESQANRVTNGLLKSDCHLISIAVDGDTDDECAFLFQATRFIETENLGEVGLPPIFEKLLTHPAIIYTNIGIFDDIAVIINAFYGGRLPGVKYAELQAVMEDRWGEDTPEGVQAIFHQAFPHLTLPKDQWVTRGHWWISRLADRQIEYALLDTVSMGRVLRTTGDLASQPVSAFSVVFPDRVIRNRPQGLLVRDVSMEDGVSLELSRPSYPDFFLRVCQAYALKFPALLPCNSAEGVHYLFRFTFEEWKLAEVRRKEELSRGSCEVDWDDLDGPSDPNRFKSTEPLLHQFMGEQMDRFLTDPTCNLQDAAALDQWLFGAGDAAAEEQEILSGACDLGGDGEEEMEVDELEVGAAEVVEMAPPNEESSVELGESPPTPSSPSPVESSSDEPREIPPVRSPLPSNPPSPVESAADSSELPPTPTTPPPINVPQPVVGPVVEPVVEPVAEPVAEPIAMAPINDQPVPVIPGVVVTQMAEPEPLAEVDQSSGPVSEDVSEIEVLKEIPANLQAPAQAEESMGDGPDSDVEILDMEYEVTDNERNQVVSGEEDASPSHKQVGPRRHQPGKTGLSDPGVSVLPSSSQLPDLPSGRNDGAMPSCPAFDPSSYLRRPALKVYPPPPVNRIERWAKTMKYGKKAITHLLKAMPRETGPEALGYAAARFSFPHESAAKCLRIALTHFSSVWNDIQKRRFLTVFRQSGLMHMPTAAAVLQYEDWDPMLVLSSSAISVLRIFEGRAKLAENALRFYENIWNLSIDFKMALATQQVFYHPSQQDQYLRVLEQGYLKTLMADICRMFGSTEAACAC